MNVDRNAEQIAASARAVAAESDAGSMTEPQPPATTARPARPLGGAAMITALLTAAIGAGAGGSVWHLYGAAAYVAVALGALSAPPMITVQVIAGQLLAASLLLRPDAPPFLLLLTMVIGVVATAELLAQVARIQTSVDFDPREEVHRVVVSAAVGGSVFGMVVLLGRVPGPTGLAAIGLASAACVIVAIVLASDTGRRPA